jgi:quercetin dioxygenase-like cupin family protein
MIKRLGLTIVCAFVFLSAKSQYNKDIIIEPLLKTDTTTLGQKIEYPDFKDNEVSIMKITIKPGKSTGWHKHVFPVFAYVLKGTLTVELENHQRISYPQNSSFSEVINMNHNGSNKGKKDVVLIAFFLGEKGKALSIHQ